MEWMGIWGEKKEERHSPPDTKNEADLQKFETVDKLN